MYLKVAYVNKNIQQFKKYSEGDFDSWAEGAEGVGLLMLNNWGSIRSQNKTKRTDLRNIILVFSREN